MTMKPTAEQIAQWQDMCEAAGVRYRFAMVLDDETLVNFDAPTRSTLCLRASQMSAEAVAAHVAAHLSTWKEPA